jgi:hypothetical protein
MSIFGSVRVYPKVPFQPFSLAGTEGLKGNLGVDPPVTEFLQSYFHGFGRSKIRIKFEVVLMSRV